MRVGICYTKKSPECFRWIEAFKKGVVLSGDRVIDIVFERHVPLLNNCDVSFQICEHDFSNSEDSLFRKRIKAHQELSGKRRIILDVGFIRGGKGEPFDERYMSLNIDSIKRSGTSCNDRPSDRWDKLNIDLPVWRTSGDHILVLGQTEHGIGTLNLREQGKSLIDWSQETLVRLRELSDRPIIYKPHPAQVNLPKMVKNSTIFNSRGRYNIKDALNNCWCTVASASNGACDSIVSGIPVITENEMSVAYDVSDNDLKNVENPRTTDIKKWLNNISYRQWNIKETKAGEAWNHLKKELEKKDGGGL